ncbi:MAG: dephospho-CoA kinase [Wenzhouxiangellaceae bacterium]|nr:dephospho-CoA kinase [Wenzhouxiangellaceae bacterium]
MQKRKTLIVALTGGIASGKTAVSDAFAELGVPVVDTDRLARQAVEVGSEGLGEVRAAFGERIVNEAGELDRRALRDLIFNDPQARRRLESILHPRIVEQARRRLDDIDTDYAILVVPLLAETGLFSDADRVLVVDVPEKVQIQRLLERDGVNRGQAESSLRAQANRKTRMALADEVIENTGTLEDLRLKVEQLDQKYRSLAAARQD